MANADFFLAHSWLADAPRRLVCPVLADPDTIDCGGVRMIPVETINRALASESDETVRTVAVVGEDWRCTYLDLFNPLVFFCAFGDELIFECLEWAIRSLVEFGCYRHDIAVITREVDRHKVEAMGTRLGLGTRLHVVIQAQAEDIVDFCLARFEIADHPVFRGRQPLIYSDCDVFTDAPVQPVLAALVRSNCIHVAPEGRLDEGHPQSDGHWYGWRMMEQDGMAFDPAAPGFSAGFIAYGHSSIGLRFASLALEVARQYQRASGRKQPFLGYDQCIANYALLKSGTRSFDVVGDALQLFRLVEGQETQPPPRTPRGFVHFLAVPTAGKLVAMTRYAASLRQAAAVP